MATTDLATRQQQLATLSVAELKGELQKALTVTAEHLRYLAAVWNELENRGEDLSHLKTGLVGYLPMIAHNRIDPRLIVQYADRKTVLAAISRLPIAEQERLADTGHVTLATTDSDGHRQDVERPLNKLSQSELYQVFSEDGIRAPDQQYALLEKRSERRDRRSDKRKDTVRTISSEHVGGDTYFKIGNKRIKEASLLKALAEHYQVDEKTLEGVLGLH